MLLTATRHELLEHAQCCSAVSEIRRSPCERRDSFAGPKLNFPQ